MLPVRSSRSIRAAMRSHSSAGSYRRSSGQQRRVNRRRQGTSVGRSRLIEVEVRGSESATTSSGTRWCSISTSACLTTCALAARSAPSSQSAAMGRRGATSEMTIGSSSPNPGTVRTRRVAGSYPSTSASATARHASRSAPRHVHQVGRSAQVPPGHHVGERVVVDHLVVLVRPDHAVDVCSSVEARRTREAQ